MDMTTTGRARARGGRRLAIGLALLVCVSSLGFAAPTALGQAVPAQADSVLDRLAGFDRGGRPCSGRADPEGAEPFLRTELFFGTNKPDGTAVTEAEFQVFLNDEITPRFPDGLTLLTGLGQFRGSNGVIQRERSLVLVLLYPVDTARSSGQKIEDIRTAYKRKFSQESVLRADEARPECVSF
jgi:hypothetical protein